MATADTFPADKAARDLIRVYAQAQRDLTALIRAALAAGQLHDAAVRREQLATVIAFLARLGVQTDPQAARIVADAFQQSDQLTVTRLQRLNIGPVTVTSFAGVNTDAIVVMQDAILSRLQDARRTVGRQAADVYARAGRRATMLELLGARGSRRTASAQMRQELQAQGVTGFTDKAGRRWSLDRYAEMAVRTTTREAVVEASKLRMAAHGVNVARVSTHASACPVCQPWEGKLVSLDGSVTEVDGEPAATLDALPNGGPPFHPQCRHTLQPTAHAIDVLARGMGSGAVA